MRGRYHERFASEHSAAFREIADGRAFRIRRADWLARMAMIVQDVFGAVEVQVAKGCRCKVNSNSKPI